MADWTAVATTVGVAALTGATGIVAGALGTRNAGAIAEKQRSHDFDLRRDERRARVYVDLLEVSARTIVIASRTYPVVDFGGMPSLPPPSEERTIRLSAEVVAYGSEQVKHLTEEWAGKQAAFANHVTMVRQMESERAAGTFDKSDWSGETQTTARMKLNDARADLIRATEAIRKQVSSELNPAPVDSAAMDQSGK